MSWIYCTVCGVSYGVYTSTVPDVCPICGGVDPRDAEIASLRALLNEAEARADAQEGRADAYRAKYMEESADEIGNLRDLRDTLLDDARKAEHELEDSESHISKIEATSVERVIRQERDALRAQLAAAQRKNVRVEIEFREWRERTLMIERERDEWQSAAERHCHDSIEVRTRLDKAEVHIGRLRAELDDPDTASDRYDSEITTREKT